MNPLVKLVDAKQKLDCGLIIVLFEPIVFTRPEGIRAMDNIGMNVTVYSGKPPRAHLLDFIQLEDIRAKNNHFLYSLKVLLKNGRKVRCPARAISQLVKISQQLCPPACTLFLCDALAEVFNVSVPLMTFAEKGTISVPGSDMVT